MYAEIALNEITDRVQVRKINSKGVEVLKTKIEQNGYNNSKPIRVVAIAGGYLLIDGNHRVEACQELGMGTIPAIVDSLEGEFDQLKQARLDNYDTEAVIPTTFVDDAELVWSLRDKHTQEAIGGIMGWSRGKVSQYSMLNSIATEVWEVVASNTHANVAEDATTVAIFNEGLLRQILDLTPPQQLELVTNLIKSSDPQRAKREFKNNAQSYKMLNKLVTQAKKDLAHCGDDYITEAIQAITANPKCNYEGLIAGLIRKYEKVSGLKLLSGKFEDLISDILSSSIDAIITDIPYGISGQGKVTRVGKDDIEADFGEWDNDADYLDNVDYWMLEFERVMAEGSNLVMFIDKIMVTDVIKIGQDKGLNYKNTILWIKPNAQPASLMRNNLISSVEMALWFTKGKDYPFNKSSLWDRRNYISVNSCVGNERLKGDDGLSLHPTQKPVALMSALVDVFSHPNQVVFDGFMGTGSTGEACKMLNRKFTGIEQNTEYYEAAKRRLTNEH